MQQKAGTLLKLPAFRSEIRGLPRNVKVNIFALPLWSIPNGLVVSYASLYMLDQGILATQVGVINSLSFIVKTIFALFAGYIINRMGRRRAAGILDIIGWALPMFIFAFATAYWHFIAASLINCLVVVNGVATTCLMVEDVPKEKRLHAQSYMGMMGALCSLFVPLSGVLISHFTLVPAMRMMYLFAAVSMLAAALAKLIFARETTIGAQLRSRKKLDINPFKVMPRQMRSLVRNKQLLVLFVLNLVLQFATNINNLFYFPYLTKFLSFSELAVSFFPFITTLISLGIYFFVIPRVSNMTRSLKYSVACYFTGALVLLLAASITQNLAYLCVLLWAVASAAMSPLLTTSIANAIKDENRTEMMSFFNVLSMLCMFPAGSFGGWLYDYSPLYPIVFIAGIYLCALVFLLFYARGTRRLSR